MFSRGSAVERLGLGLFFLLTVAPVGASLLYAALRAGCGRPARPRLHPGALAPGAVEPETWASVGLFGVATVVAALTAGLALLALAAAGSKRPLPTS
jgi:hypothetical protein